MRIELTEAGPGETLRDVLARTGPPGMAPFLKEGPGFRLGFAAPDVAPERVGDGPPRFRFGGTGVVASVSINLSAELGVAVQSVTLLNEGPEPSPPIRELDAFLLPLDVQAGHSPRACGFGGGLTDGFYPPRAYRPEEVTFGEARSWVPASRGFHRWWVGKGAYALESRPDGRSSNPNLPVMMAGWNADDIELGLWAALEWSGRWRMSFGNGQDWRFVFRGGPLVKGLVLEPGETLRLPRVHVGVWGGPERPDFTNSIRRYVAQVLAPDVEGQRPRPYAAYDTWFGHHERISDAILRPEIDRAAELGLEYFVIDAAWYPATTEKFWTGVGNWERVDEAKFPDGLEPIAEYAKSRGLRFGLWFEPERGYNGSDWMREHPEWFFQVPGRNSGHLKLPEREVQDGLIEMLSTWIERLDIRWLRWDNNQAPGPFWDEADPTGKVQFAYMEGLYRVFDVLLERHPNLMIDNCAGGGQRIDFGTLARAGTMVISDHAEDSHVCRIMQTGGARVFPGNYMNSSLYVGEEDAARASAPLALVSRMAGSITLCGHIADWTDEEAALVKRYIDGFKAYRHLLMKDFVRLTDYPRSDADWDAVEFLDPETHEAVVLAYRVRGETSSLTVFPKGLAARKGYRVIDPFSSKRPKTVAGGRLMEKGLQLAAEPESGLVRHLVPSGRRKGKGGT